MKTSVYAWRRSTAAAPSASHCATSQYLAALYTEIYLDRLFNARAQGRSSAAPLLAYWIATGSSDVLTVVRFLQRFLSDRAWAIKTLKAVLDGKTGLVAPDGSDVCAGRFPFLRELGSAGVCLPDLGTQASPVSRLHISMTTSFNASSTPQAAACMCARFKSSPGELGLKAANAGDYSGVISIGDTSAFKKLVEEDSGTIALEEDAIAGSFFEHINRPDSGLHVLIGAKKFMEGWNSWCVASMGFLNIGRQEGSQIIQCSVENLA
ncbi:MAG: hypothetical protein KatS3mg052_0671 [Candidatus Roseilinea sp.]|nr:MAG: hypothetical protein KatS3mg052_0671 [Candidatus Roseilinea sp.]